MSPRPGCATRPTSRSATTCGSAYVVSRCWTAPHGTPTDPSRSSQSATVRSVKAPSDARGQILLRAERRRVGRNEVGRVDRRVLQVEESEKRAPLRDVETCEGNEAVRRLVAAVVRVHGDATGDLVRSRLEVAAIRGLRRYRVVLAGEPDEILELDRHRGREERDVDDLSCAGLPGADERGEHSGREQEPRCEVGHGDPARAHRYVVAA